jgi:hypothetical protein
VGDRQEQRITSRQSRQRCNILHPGEWGPTLVPARLMCLPTTYATARRHSSAATFLTRGRHRLGAHSQWLLTGLCAGCRESCWRTNPPDTQLAQMDSRR